MNSKAITIPFDLIAPCGMNCRLCWGYIREKNRCPGCRRIDKQESQKSKHRTGCTIRNCEHLADSRQTHCSGNCDNFPCTRLKNLDKRYRTKYGMSMLENLQMIHSAGIREFNRVEKRKWMCPECGSLICVHRPTCLACGHVWN